MTTSRNQKDKRVSSSSPMHIIFIADDSGSMKGQPAEQINTSISMWINELARLCDVGTKNWFYFSLITFGTKAKIHDAYVPLLEVNPNIAPLNGKSGGTNFAPALRAAQEVILTHKPPAEHCPPFVFFYTDGKADDEQDALQEASALKQLDLPCGPPRLVTLGFYQAESEFLEKMASFREWHIPCDDCETLAAILPDLGSWVATDSVKSVEQRIKDFQPDEWRH
jgi:uncharacterized protein YegL